MLSFAVNGLMLAAARDDRDLIPVVAQLSRVEDLVRLFERPQGRDVIYLASLCTESWIWLAA